MQLSGSDLRLLAVFDAVVRCQGFAAAEAELNISASTISNHMTALEHRLGIKLCQRGRAGFALTDGGRAVHEATRTLLASTQHFASEIEAARVSPPSELRIGLVDTVASDPNCRIAEAVRAFRGRMPAVSILLSQDPPQELQAKVREGEYHCGIGSFPHLVSGLEEHTLYKEAHLLYVGAGHPLFAMPDCEITPELIERYDTIRRGYWRDRDGRRFQLGPARATVNQIEPQILLVLSGLYTGFLPEHAATAWVARGGMRPILAERYRFDCKFGFVTRKGSPEPEMLRIFRDCCLAAHRPEGAPRAALRQVAPRLAEGRPGA
ncbi:LysR family transcriptional regulator, partial [Propylenella binzhouense]